MDIKSISIDLLTTLKVLVRPPVHHSHLLHGLVHHLRKNHPLIAMAQGRHKHLVICRQLEDCLSNLSFMGDQPSSNACRTNIDSNVELGRSHNLKLLTKYTAGTSFQLQEGVCNRGVRYFYITGKSILKYLNIRMFKKRSWRKS